MLVIRTKITKRIKLIRQRDNQSNKTIKLFYLYPASYRYAACINLSYYTALDLTTMVSSQCGVVSTIAIVSTCFLIDMDICRMFGTPTWSCVDFWKDLGWAASHRKTCISLCSGSVQQEGESPGVWTALGCLWSYLWDICACESLYCRRERVHESGQL